MLIYGGLFVNIVYGCNFVMVIKFVLKFGDVVIIEVGFGVDLGVEKFFDIKCRYVGIKFECVVIVVIIRVLKYYGGVLKMELNVFNVDVLVKGIINLEK